MPSPHQKLFLITGSSGVGKNAIITELTKRYPVLQHITSVTTRWPARDEEQFGDSYYFTDEERFKWLSETGQFIETTSVYGASYGTLAIDLERAWSSKRQPITSVDTRGIENYRAKDYEVVAIFLDFPSTDEQKHRILHRQPNISPETLDERLSVAAEERAWAAKESQAGRIHIVVNDKLGACTTDVANIFQLNLS